METKSLYPVNLYGLHMLTGTFRNVAQWMVTHCFKKDDALPIIISHINVYNYCQLLQNPQFKNELQTNSYLLFDGIGLKLAAFMTGQGWLPDLNGTDLFPMILERGAEKRLKIYCLGTGADLIERAVDKIKQQFPGVEVTGYNHGFFKTEEEHNIVDKINVARPDLLVVGMGFITQESFAIRHRNSLDAKVIWNVGGLFDVVSGKKPRTPPIMRKLRLEWLFRFVLEPRRMWRRNVICMPYFFVHIIIKGIKSIRKQKK